MKSPAVLTISTLLAAAALPATAAAQVPLTPRALGMGGAYTAVARGQEVVFQNPANLALPGNPHWSVAFPQIMAGGTALGLGIEDIRDIQNYDDIEEGRAGEILDAIPETGTDVEYDLRIPIAAIQFRRFAFGVSYNSVGNHTVGKDLIDLLLRGYQEGRFDYDTGNTSGRRATWVDFAASTARRFGPVSVGITGHYYLGRTLANSDLGPIEVDDQFEDFSATYSGVRAEGGSGFGVDVGVAIQPLPGVTLSAALANAFSDMSWGEDLRQREVTITEADVEVGEFGDLETRYAQSETDYTGEAPFAALAETLYEETDFARQVRLGAAWEPRVGTSVAAAYHGDLEDSRLSGLWDQQLSVGAQQRLAFFTVRAGLASNLDDGSMLSGGLSLGPLQFGVARINRGETAGADRNGWIFSFGVTGRTNSTMQ